jgi:hypothetical protein
MERAEMPRETHVSAEKSKRLWAPILEGSGLGGALAPPISGVRHREGLAARSRRVDGRSRAFLAFLLALYPLIRNVHR